MIAAAPQDKRAARRAELAATAPKRVPAWAHKAPPCAKTCGGRGVYLGAHRVGSKSWAEYRCDNCPCHWSVGQLWA